MPEKDYNKVFARRLRYYMDKLDITQVELAKKLNVGSTSIYNWLNGIKSPRMDKIDAMCEIFGCKRSDLITDIGEEKGKYYYLNDETAQIAQEIFENEDLRALFDVQKDMNPDELKALKDMVLALKGKERRDDDAGC